MNQEKRRALYIGVVTIPPHSIPLGTVARIPLERPELVELLDRQKRIFRQRRQVKPPHTQTVGVKFSKETAMRGIRMLIKLARIIRKRRFQFTRRGSRAAVRIGGGHIDL